jgi:hypothetical protein
MKGIREWLEKNKSSLDTMSVKMNPMDDTRKTLILEQERIKGQVNLWETRLRKMQEEHNFMYE